MKEIKLTYKNADVEAIATHFEKIDKLEQLSLKLIAMRAQLKKSK